MKQAILFPLLLLLLVSFATGCAEQTTGTSSDAPSEAEQSNHSWVKLAPLEESVKQEVDAALQAEYGHKPWWYSGGEGVRYYGTYGDCIVLFSTDFDDLLDCSQTSVIADQIFYHNRAFRLTVYHDGQFISLEDAYQTSLLTKEQITQIAAYHDGFQRSTLSEQYDKTMSTIYEASEMQESIEEIESDEKNDDFAGSA